MMRLFVAAELAAEVREAIGAVVDRLSRELDRVRFVPRENLHVTIKFLGEVTEERMEGIANALGQAIGPLELPFPIAASGIGTFGGGRPRVIWAGVDDPSGSLKRMHHAVESALSPLGFPREERPFSPHVTLARLKRPVAGVALRLAPFRQAAFGTTHVAGCTLFRSRLESRGARYEPLRRFPATPTEDL